MAVDPREDVPPFHLRRLDDTTWELPCSARMQAPVRVLADDTAAQALERDPALGQMAQVAELPGLVDAVLGVPNLHAGNGFPAGCVTVTDPDRGGVVAPMGIGHDIGCGLTLSVVAAFADHPHLRLPTMLDAFAREIPLRGSDVPARSRCSEDEVRGLLNSGLRALLARESCAPAELESSEDRGCHTGADANCVSRRALDYAQAQFGSLGSGNAFVALGAVEAVYDRERAEALGLEPEQLTLAVYAGSRGVGFQVSEDYMLRMGRAVLRQSIRVPDRALNCAHVHSREARDYLAAMAAAANFAAANRRQVRRTAEKALARALRIEAEALDARIVADQCMALTRFEVSPWEGKRRRLCVHRKGAPRIDPSGARPVAVTGAPGDGILLCVAGPRPGVTFNTGCAAAPPTQGHAHAFSPARASYLAAKASGRILEEAGALRPIAFIRTLAIVRG